MQTPFLTIRRILPESCACALLVWAVTAFAADIPEGWQLFKINDKKKLTAYRIINEGGQKVLHARAEASASGLQRAPAFRLAERPILHWRWKVSRLIPGADNSKPSGEDAPARILLVFDGDMDKLPRKDQAVFYLARQLSGQDLPYATLMYIWSGNTPVGTVIENPHTRRIQMVVASSGAAAGWQEVSRDAIADFRRAFKEEPGRLLAYGVMTDTDNTGETVEAWYGPIEFRPRP